MKAEVVFWPRNESERNEVAAQFALLRGFSRCLGAVDGSFVKILRPTTQSKDPDAFNCRKMYHAIQMQNVALPNLSFTDAFVGWPASRTDSHILQQSPLYHNHRTLLGPSDYLFGDSGYPIKSWLITPYTKKQIKKMPTAEKRRSAKDFNFNHASTRVVVEQAFGLLKSRFRCLSRGLYVRQKHATSVVMACIVLHNICIRQGDSWHRPEFVAPDPEPTQDPSYDGTSNTHHSGTVCRSTSVGPDPDVGVSPPQWLVVRREDRGAGSAANEESLKSKEKQRRAGCGMRDRLRAFVTQCPRCRRFT